MKINRSHTMRYVAMATTLVTFGLRADETAPTTVIDATKAAIEYSVGPELVKVPVEEIERAYEGKKPPEAIRMYLAIVRGSMMGAGDGWFGPAQVRYDWEWLAKRLPWLE